MHKSPTLFKEVQGHISLKGIQIHLSQPTPQYEVKGYIIDMFLEQFERKLKTLEIKGKKTAKAYMPPSVKEHVLQAEVGSKVNFYASNHNKPRVLIADDSYSELQLVEMALKDAGYDTVTVMDGEAAE